MSTTTKTPRRVRTTGTRQHVGRWGHVSRFVYVERVRLVSVCGARRNYEWRTMGALEVSA